MKKCSLCRRDLVIGAGPQCENCKRYRAKYGAPTTCKYCQLPAAFVDKKCVYCAHNERKNGPPIQCSHCQLRSAFCDSQKPSATTLCRLCHAVYGSSSRHKRASHEKSDSIAKKPRSDNHNSLLTQPNSSTAANTTAATFGTAPASTSAPNNQRFKDQIEELKATIREKNVVIKDLQQKLGQLGAEQVHTEKELRQKLVNMEKQNDATVSQLQYQLKQLNRELAVKRAKN